ncbi:hypothetical protein [Nitrincola iocasae]|uniref:Tle cognate immunity protein 4 C-terminal domain-containing protein n=1 Tax=Nitrincola iocasae TaxID=2614693 RepID=A0A5J6LG96_9GAMM|nr:hypothetical protein [Nitrincola iocasae]QEW07587.1 hypothetical protein F5I99_14360 [Nitrincola iocasae]
MANADEFKTYCIGRLLIDIPVSFELVNQSGWAYVSEFERLGPGGHEEAERIAREQVNALKDGVVTSQTGRRQLYLSQEKIGDVYVVSRQGDYSTSSMDLSYMWFEDAFFSSQGVVFRAAIVMDETDADTQRQKLLRVANATRPREPDEIPRGEGSCVAGAFIALPPEGEVQGATFRLPNEDPIGVRISFSLRKPGERELDLEAAQSNIGSRITIAGLPGRYGKDYGREIFYMASVGQQTTDQQFGLSLDVRYFDRRRPFGVEPFTREKADQIWDRLVDSARIRR